MYERLRGVKIVQTSTNGVIQIYYYYFVIIIQSMNQPIGIF